MDIQEYSRLALRTATKLGHNGDMLHAALLIASEAGEVAGVVKKTHAYGRPMDYPHMLEELGDLIWGINLMIKTMGFSWENVLDSNIAKLEARYPNLRFDAEHATHRNKDAENAAMATVPSRRCTDKVEG